MSLLVNSFPADASTTASRAMLAAVNKSFLVSSVITQFLATKAPLPRHAAAGRFPAAAMFYQAETISQATMSPPYMPLVSVIHIDASTFTFTPRRQSSSRRCDIAYLFLQNISRG